VDVVDVVVVGAVDVDAGTVVGAGLTVVGGLLGGGVGGGVGKMVATGIVVAGGTAGAGAIVAGGTVVATVVGGSVVIVTGGPMLVASTALGGNGGCPDVEVAAPKVQASTLPACGW
jgi:hypothetical protein